VSALYPWLVFLHVLAAIAWIGGGLMLTLFALRARSSGDQRAAADFAAGLPWVALRGLTPAIATLLLTGVALVLTGAGWSFTQPWILAALALLVVAFLIGAVYLSRVGAALLRVAGEGAGSADVRAVLDRWLLGYGAVLLILVAVVWDMVFKPGL
jgi:uncharacterized membrane protein